MFLQVVHCWVATSVHRGQIRGVVGVDVMMLTGVGVLVLVLVLNAVGWLVDWVE
jgi:hypothetical protein